MKRSVQMTLLNTFLRYDICSLKHYEKSEGNLVIYDHIKWIKTKHVVLTK